MDPRAGSWGAGTWERGSMDAHVVGRIVGCRLTSCFGLVCDGS